MRKKYLLVGDYRTCENFGSISACEQLLELLRPRAVSIIPYTRMDQDYDYMPDSIDDFSSFADQVTDGKILSMERAALERADHVLLNAEGGFVKNIHLNTSRYRGRSRHLLFLGYYAKTRLNKPVDIINHTVDPSNSNADEIISKLYPLLDRVWVREKLSLRYLESLGYNDASFVPDSLFGYTPDQPCNKENYVCISDSASLGYVQWDYIRFYERLIDKIRLEGMEVIFIDGNMWKSTDLIYDMCNRKQVQWVHPDNTDWRALAKILGGAQTFFSGRWHASILATIVGTPSVLFTSDSHKTKALHSLIDIESKFYDINNLPERFDELFYDITIRPYDNTRLVKLSGELRSSVLQNYALL